MKKTYDSEMALADEETTISGKIVICNHHLICNEALYCGGAIPHMYQPEECGNCPVHKEARCYPYKEKYNMPTDLEIKFAKEICYSHIGSEVDYEYRKVYYYCAFCDGESLTYKLNENIARSEIEEKLIHDKDCITHEAKRVIKDAISEGIDIE